MTGLPSYKLSGLVTAELERHTGSRCCLLELRLFAFRTALAFHTYIRLYPSLNLAALLYQPSHNSSFMACRG